MVEKTRMQLPRWDAAVARNQLEALSRLQSGRDFKEIISCLSLSLPFLLFIMFVVANSESWETVDHVDIAVRLIALVIPMAFCISSLSRWVGVSATMARAFGGYDDGKLGGCFWLVFASATMLVFMFVVNLTLFLRAVGPDLRARSETGPTTRTTAWATDESDPPPAPATTDEWTVHEPAHGQVGPGVRRGHQFQPQQSFTDDRVLAGPHVQTAPAQHEEGGRNPAGAEPNSEEEGGSMPEVAVKALAISAEARKLLETPGHESAVIKMLEDRQCFGTLYRSTLGQTGTLHMCIREFNQAVAEKKTIEQNARREDERKYSAFFGKCNHESCRKAKHEHFGSENQCFDPQVLVAAVKSHHKAVKLLETLNEGFKSAKQTYDRAEGVLYKIGEESMRVCSEKEAQGELQEASQHAERAMEAYKTLNKEHTGPLEVYENWCSRMVELLESPKYQCPVCSQRFVMPNSLECHLRDKQDGAHLKHRSSAPDPASCSEQPPIASYARTMRTAASLQRIANIRVPGRD